MQVIPCHVFLYQTIPLLSYFCSHQLPCNHTILPLPSAAINYLVTIPNFTYLLWPSVTLLPYHSSFTFQRPSSTLLPYYFPLIFCGHQLPCNHAIPLLPSAAAIIAVDVHGLTENLIEDVNSAVLQSLRRF